MTNLAVISGPVDRSSQPAIEEALNPLGLLELETALREVLLASVAQHADAPCRTKSFRADEDFMCLLAGDIVNHDQLDWETITRAFASGDRAPECVRKLRGAFGLVVIDRRSDRMWIVTDPSAWISVLIRVTDNHVAVSTSLAAVIRAAPAPVTVNDDWVYESFYFNHGCGKTTPVFGIERLPPGTVTEVDLGTRQVSHHVLHSRPSAPDRLLSGRAAAERAIDVFRDVVPRYFPDDLPVTMGISEGLDCRTVLAALPETDIRKLHSFTFGMPDSSEIVEAQAIAAHLGLAHTPVLLDDEFLGQLSDLARDTVFLSGGQQNINRSHLLYTYSRLHCNGRPFPVIMTGVSGDHIFRDHIQGWGNVPHILSADAAAQHRLGRHRVDREFYTQVFGERFDPFEARIEVALDALQEEFGEFGDPEAYLSYLMYEVGPRYFGGQTAIANMFSTFRTPYWDTEIIELGYALQEATLGFSASLPSKDLYAETYIQTKIIAEHPLVAQLPYKNLPIGAYARGQRTGFQFYRLLRKLRSVLSDSRFVHSEDWQLWYRTVMDEEVRQLLGQSSRIRSYVSAEIVDRAISTADVHWLGKLITAEHTIRFIENGWQRT